MHKRADKTCRDAEKKLNNRLGLVKISGAVDVLCIFIFTLTFS